MFLIYNLFWCCVLFISRACANNKTLLSLDHNSTNITLKETLVYKNTTFVLPSEGGSITQNLPPPSPVSLLNGNENIPASLVNELSNDNSTAAVVSKSKIVPRKEAIFYSDENTTMITKTMDEKLNNVTLIGGPSDKVSIHDKTLVIPLVSDSTKTHLNKSVEHNKLNQTQTPKKPLTLSYEGLASMDQGVLNDQWKLPAIVSSSKTLVSDQMPLPKENGPTSKMHPIIANRPGMIMPIIISILVVPMFAVLGYMALRRGREAWKNRHYKRMDFLLDGMYND